MKILHVSTYDGGGAAKSCIRLHLALLQHGIESHILFLLQKDKSIPHTSEYKIKPKPLTTFNKIINKGKIILKELKLYNEPVEINYLKNQQNGFYPFTFPYSDFDITDTEVYKNCDIINLHWVANLFDYSFFKKNKKPVVWTMHDMNPFTGGCHHSLDCKKYEVNCDVCPQLAGTTNPSYSAEILKIKQESLANFEKLTIVTPSHWLRKCSSNSTLFRKMQHFTFPYSIDADTFNIRNKAYSRSILGIAEHKKVCLFVAQNIDMKLKGIEYLIEAVQNLINSNPNLLIVAVGGTISKSPLFIGSSDAFKNSVLELGTVYDEKLMSIIYSAADVFAFPSLAENLPNVIIESLFCGTPILAYNVGGIPELIAHQENGYLCNEINVESLQNAIHTFFNSNDLLPAERIREMAVEKYSTKVQLNNYLTLYSKLLS